MASGGGPQWVWPSLEEQSPPPVGEADAGFGPVYLNDEITLLFTPSDYTGDLTWYCYWDNTDQGAYWNITNTGSPLTYTFNETTPNTNDASDTHICHFYNLDGSIGNSQTFQYFNFPGKQRTHWSQAGKLPVTSSASSTSSSAAPTKTSSSAGSATTSSSGRGGAASASASGTAAADGNRPTSNAAVSSSSSTSSHLTPGADAGIAIGCIAAVALIGALIFFLLRRRRRGSRQYSEPSAFGTEVSGPSGPTSQTAYEYANHKPPPQSPPGYQEGGWRENATTNVGEMDTANAGYYNTTKQERSELPGS